MVIRSSRKRRKTNKLSRKRGSRKTTRLSRKRRKTNRSSRKRRVKRVKKQKGGVVRKHMMYRYLSEEDRLALNLLDQNNSFENETVSVKLSSNEDDKNSIYDGKLIQSSFKQHPEVIQMIKDITAEVKREKIPTSKKRQKLNHRLNVLESEFLDNVNFIIKVNVKKSFYPIDNEGLSMLDEVTVNKYLTSHSWVGVRTTHGIHGFFTYMYDPRFTPNFYEDYGYWDGVHGRDTGGHNVGSKDIFITSFMSEEERNGDLSTGSFNNNFTKLDSNEPLNVEFKDCSEGGITAEGVNPTANERGVWQTLGDDSVCHGFDGLPEGDTIKYARLGRLMPERRRQEINFRGKGKISGYHIKMNEYEVSYETNNHDKKDIYDFILSRIIETFNMWRDIPENMGLHKKLMNNIHSRVISHFEKNDVEIHTPGPQESTDISELPDMDELLEIDLPQELLDLLPTYDTEYTSPKKRRV